MSVLTLTSLSLITTVLVVNIHHRQPPVSMPRALRFLVFRIIARVVCLHKQVSTTMSQNEVKPSDQPIANENSSISIDTTRSNKMNNVRMERASLEGKLEAFQEDMLCALKQLFDERARRETEDSGSDQWKLLAKILDRLFLILFLISVVVVNVVLIGIYPFV